MIPSPSFLNTELRCLISWLFSEDTSYPWWNLNRSESEGRHSVVFIIWNLWRSQYSEYLMKTGRMHSNAI